MTIRNGSRVAAQMRRTSGTPRATHARRLALRSVAMNRPGVLTLTLAALAIAAPVAVAQTAAQPLVPATTNARSPFVADRPSSEPLGLSPAQVVDPFTYPDEPVVLSWSPVPGAVRYIVEIAGSPGFTRILWKTTTDQVQVAPEVLLPDGTYWWRVTAVDTAGTRGMVSRAGTFAKEWPNRVSGGVLSATPGGAAGSLVRITPYMRWSALPGAAYYETQVAAADGFASPAFTSQNLPTTTINPGVAGVLPDDSYSWRVRALDPAKNPGPWVDMGGFTKAWVAPTLVGPADGAVTHNFHVRWEPVPGAEAYQVQVTRQEHNWQGNPLMINHTTASTGFVPSLKDQTAKGMGYGVHWWRVRPVVNGVLGTWSEPRRIDWQPAPNGDRTATAQLAAAADSSSALTPQMSWTPVLGATLYRVDVATDAQFNNIVESATTRSTAWATRLPLQDNQVREGYFWRVVWGSGAGEEQPDWMVSESTVAVGQFRKQTSVVLGTAASGVISDPPLFTWSDVPGAAKYELQISRDTEFDSARSQTMSVWGLGTAWTKDAAKRLPSGTWFWRVRAVDANGAGQTWSPVGSFTVSPARVQANEPNDDQVVVGSPMMRWNPVTGACGYQVQVSDNPSFQSGGDTSDTDQGGDITPGAPNGEAPEAENVVLTPQAAFIPSGKIVTGPGRWYWRVRTVFCADKDYSPWSVARSFRSVRPPNFNLNAVPTSADFGTRVTVAGRLVHNGAGVRNATLLLERRPTAAADYRAFGTVKGDIRGRFAFSVRVDRSATWRLRWVKTAEHPEGFVPFVIRATPRVSFSLSRTRAVRRSRVIVKGSVYPRRPALIQVRESSGWKTVRRVAGRRSRFSIALPATMTPGNQRLRLYVPQDARRILEAKGSRQRSLFVYDKFVIRRRG